MSIPDWQLPPGVDRGLWDYLHSGEMVRGYDGQMNASPLATADVSFCERVFDRPGWLIDLGCGTGRLCVHFARLGYDCVGVDLSDEMLTQARANADRAGVTVEWRNANLVELTGVPDGHFDYAACLFSTLGMVRWAEHRIAVARQAFRVLRPGGWFVLHVHNRYFRGLGWGRVVRQAARSLLGRADAGDVTMSQAYGGAPLTLHHFTRREATLLLTATGFLARTETAVCESGREVPPGTRAYGYLIAAEKPES
ncbi:MAG TPA: class I SAM-dependent methyltransferase [Fimbriiglobus sp.]|jgi:SAM-dependent methyltransferase|nr:class I SAM-dependent methyltransferase [Fimbriiglobus sp.]